MGILGIDVGASDSDNMASRGKRKHTEEFWSDVTARFGVKSWGIVEEDKPLSYLSMRISKRAKNGITWIRRIIFISS